MIDGGVSVFGPVLAGRPPLLAGVTSHIFENDATDSTVYKSASALRRFSKRTKLGNERRCSTPSYGSDDGAAESVADQYSVPSRRRISAQFTQCGTPQSLSSNHSNSSNSHADDSNTVELNIGGEHIVSVPLCDLTRFEGSMLAAMFSGRWPLLNRDSAGRVFLDRDYKYFQYVLDYLHNHGAFTLDLPTADAGELQRVREELDYFCLLDCTKTFAWHLAMGTETLETSIPTVYRRSAVYTTPRDLGTVVERRVDSVVLTDAYLAVAWTDRIDGQLDGYTGAWFMTAVEVWPLNAADSAAPFDIEDQTQPAETWHSHSYSSDHACNSATGENCTREPPARTSTTEPSSFFAVPPYQGRLSSRYRPMKVAGQGSTLIVISEPASLKPGNTGVQVFDIRTSAAGDEDASAKDTTTSAATTAGSDSALELGPRYTAQLLTTITDDAELGVIEASERCVSVSDTHIAVQFTKPWERPSAAFSATTTCAHGGTQRTNAEKMSANCVRTAPILSTSAVAVWDRAHRDQRPQTIITAKSVPARHHHQHQCAHTMVRSEQQQRGRDHMNDHHHGADFALLQGGGFGTSTSASTPMIAVKDVNDIKVYALTNTTDGPGPADPLDRVTQPLHQWSACLQQQGHTLEGIMARGNTLVAVTMATAPQMAVTTATMAQQSDSEPTGQSHCMYKVYDVAHSSCSKVVSQFTADLNTGATTIATTAAVENASPPNGTGTTCGNGKTATNEMQPAYSPYLLTADTLAVVNNVTGASAWRDIRSRSIRTKWTQASYPAAGLLGTADAVVVVAEGSRVAYIPRENFTGVLVAEQQTLHEY